MAVEHFVPESPLLTTDPAQNGPPGGRPPGNRRNRRFDEGDLWADSAEAPPAADRPATRRREPSRAQPPSQPPPARVPDAVPPQPRAQQPLDLRQPPVAPAGLEYEDEEDEEYYEDEEPSPLSNPYVLAGIAVLGAIMLAVVVVLFFGRGNGDTQSPGAAAGATRTPTPTATGEAPGVTGLAARSIAIATVREGPALTHLELGLLQANQDVDVVGRNEEATWFQIVFPPETQLRGWVPETALRLPDDVEDIVAVVEATPVPRPEVPDPTATTAPAPQVSATPGEGDEGPDLAVVIVSDCSPGSEIVISVSYTGPEAIEDEPIEVIVSNDGAVVSQKKYQADFDVGASTSLPTEVNAKPSQMSVSVLLTNLSDVDPSNNIASCSVAGGDNVPPTLEPTATP
jgi:hypothetical protein